MSKMKKRVPAGEARRIMARVPVQQSFWLCTSDEMRSLGEMSKRLSHIDDEVFRYHVNRDKNDFEAWIRDVVGDKELAREIARVKTKETLYRKIFERVDELTVIVQHANAVKKAVRKKVVKKAAKKTAVKKKTVKRKSGAKKSAAKAKSRSSAKKKTRVSAAKKKSSGRGAKSKKSTTAKKGAKKAVRKTARKPARKTAKRRR